MPSVLGESEGYVPINQAIGHRLMNGEGLRMGEFEDIVLIYT
jgi:hypothetical protein